MLLLTYFNPIIGPDILYSVPLDIEELLSEEDAGQIKRLMDAAHPGFFTHSFSKELNTANYFFMIPSAWARGKQEMVMITKIIEEEEPKLGDYKNEFENFVQTIRKERPAIYKAFYNKNPPLNYEEAINEEFAYLSGRFKELSKFFEISQAQTHGILVPFKELRQKRSIFLPSSTLRELESFLEQKPNYFIVFQRRRETFKVEIIPYDEKRVIKFVVFFNGQLSPETLKEIGLVFQGLKLPFVYASGICQQGGKCIYEVYLNPGDRENFEDTKANLMAVRDVEDVKIIEIDIM